MKNYRPLLLQDINLQLPGLKVQRMRLNRHLPEARMTEHQHEHDQIILYLMGRGQQLIAGSPYPAGPGTVIHVPPATPHAFQQQAARPPLCLVIDLTLEASRGVAHRRDQLTAEQLSDAKARLATLFRHTHVEKREMSLSVAAVVLDILDTALKAIGWLTPVNRFGTARHFSLSRRVERLIEQHDGPNVDISAIAQRAGYQHDHLNRLLNAECGLTLGQLRSRVRLKKAATLLGQKKKVQEVAESIGILDPNYFARWFRQQTGVTPSAWRRQPRELRF